jgi:hypothetical protein
VALLFDSLGPAWRSPAVSAALLQMASDGGSERGAVFTRPEVVAAMLDLPGNTDDRSLHRMRLLEPSSGNGDFLLPAVERLLSADRLGVSNWSCAHDDLRDTVDAPVFALYGVSPSAGEHARRIADAAQVTSQRHKVRA